MSTSAWSLATGYAKIAIKDPTPCDLLYFGRICRPLQQHGGSSATTGSRPLMLINQEALYAWVIYP